MRRGRESASALVGFRLLGLATASRPRSPACVARHRFGVRLPSSAIRQKYRPPLDIVGQDFSEGTGTVAFPFHYGARVVDVRTRFRATVCDIETGKRCEDAKYDAPHAEQDRLFPDRDDETFYNFNTAIQIPRNRIRDGKFRLKVEFAYRGWRNWPTVNWFKSTDYPNLITYHADLRFSDAPAKHTALAFDSGLRQYMHTLPQAISVEILPTSEGREYHTLSITYEASKTGGARYAPVVLFLPNTAQAIVIEEYGERAKHGPLWRWWNK